MNRRKTDIDMNNLKLYIARDEGKWDEDVQKAGELNLFYDTPQRLCTHLYECKFTTWIA